MFKVPVIQATNNLFDERAEFLINDRLSFMRFLGLGLEDRVPDARTIWLFREKLTTAGEGICSLIVAVAFVKQHLLQLARVDVT
jgi:IS5 family transposase